MRERGSKHSYWVCKWIQIDEEDDFRSWLGCKSEKQGGMLGRLKGLF